MLGVVLVERPSARGAGLARAFVLVVGVASLLLGTGFVARANAAPAIGCEPVERYRLENGVEVVLAVDHSLPAVAVWSSVHVGQRNDPPGHEDLAHYVEHLTFRSAPPFTPADDLYARLGAVSMNARTSLDTTDYFAVVPSTHLEQALWIEARRLVIGLDTVTSAAALEERAVMQREYELRHGSGAERHQWAAVVSSFFPKGHPYSSRLSSPSSIAGLTLSDARWFFARHYRPERVRLVVVGDFEPARTKQLIQSSLGGLRARDAAPAVPSAPFDASPESACHWSERPPQRSHSRVVIRTWNRSERLDFVWMFPSEGSPERWLSSLATFAGTAQDAMRQAGLASRVSVQQLRLELGVVSALTIEVTRGRQLNDAESLLRKLFAEALQRERDAEEAVASRQAVKTTEVLRPDSLLSRAHNLAARLCQPAQCSPAAASTMSFDDLGHFALEHALVVEERYARSVGAEGDWEVAQ